VAEYRLAPAAEHDLELIWAAPACDQIRPGHRRRCIERHMIYFRITDYGIAVMRILPDRMDALRHL